MRLKIALVLVLLVGGCHASEPQTPEETGAMPYGKWDFAFFTPRALPAVVTYAVIIDSGDVISRFRKLDGVHENPASVGSWNLRVRRHANFNKARHPPVSTLFCWDSIIDKKTYETRIIFKPSLRETMLTPTGKNKQGEKTWYDTLLFGLAPEGKVRIWLQDSAGGGDNIPIEPKQITTFSGDKLDICKGITQHSNGYVYYGDTPEFIKDKTYPYGTW